MRHIKFIKNVYPKDKSKYLAHQNFLNLLSLVLKYEHSDKPLNDLSESDTRKMKYFYILLKNMFFNSLYIERDEEKQLLEWRTTKWCSIVSGYLGSGKTTLLLKLYDTLKQKKETDLPFYIDFTQKFATLDEYDNSLIQEKNNGGNVSTENENNPVCTVIARHIIDQIKEDINFFRDYKIFKVKHALIYNDLYMNIMENENPQNDNDWDNLLNSEAYKNRKIAIEAQSQVPPAENLELLLKFIKTKNPNRTIIIILDNLDRYSQYLQRQVYTKSLSLSRTEVVKLILAFRDTNLRSLRREGEQGDIYHIESLNTIYDSDSNLGTVSLLNTAEIIKKYLLKRIEFLKSCNADFVQREKFGELYGKPFNKDYKDFITSFGIYLTNQLMVQNQALFWVITELGVMVP